MSKPEWTEQQKNAIEAKGGTLLVSAAAGSGKTAVLVERLKRKIADKENPCSVNNILVVTFTNAAAANMKTKIAKSISEAIKEDPGNACRGRGTDTGAGALCSESYGHCRR